LSASKKGDAKCRIGSPPFDIEVDAGLSQRTIAAKPRSTLELRGDEAMRVMVIVKADKHSEAGVLPSTEILTAMTKYNEDLVKAGVMQAGEGLRPSSHGKRVKFSGNTRTVTDGPFTEAKELIAGFWLWKVESMEEAVEWLKRAPFDGGTEIELRPVFETEDFQQNMTPELSEKERRLREELGRK